MGCDGIVGSKQQKDHCGVCGGDNDSCRIIAGIYTRTHHRYGYQQITQIPKGACHINVTELSRSRNYLGMPFINCTTESKAPDMMYFSAKKYWYFSYFSMKIYIVSTAECDCKIGCAPRMCYHGNSNVVYMLFVNIFHLNFLYAISTSVANYDDIISIDIGQLPIEW